MHHRTPRTLLALSLVALLAPACGGSSGGNGGNAPEPAPNTAVITSTDFNAVGLVSVLDLDSLEIANRVAEVSTDPVPRVFEGIVYVVNRFFADNIQVIDPAQGFATTAQYSTENGSNPQDIAVIGTRGFIPRFEPDFSDLLVLDLTDGSTIGTVDLTPFADTDTDPTVLPRPQAVVEVNGLVWVALGQYDATFSIFGAGSLVAVDPDTLEVVREVSVGVQDASAFAVLGDDLYVAGSGVFFPVTLSGGVVRVDTSSGAVTSVLDDDALGGNLGSIAIVDAGLGYIQASIVNDAATASTGVIRAFNPTTGELGQQIYECDGFTPAFAYNGGDKLVALCQDFENPGVTVLDAITGATLAGPIDTVLPPFGVDFL